jgi:hypothetical protein
MSSKRKRRTTGQPNHDTDYHMCKATMYLATLRRRIAVGPSPDDDPGDPLEDILTRRDNIVATLDAAILAYSLTLDPTSHTHVEQALDSAQPAGQIVTARIIKRRPDGSETRGAPFVAGFVRYGHNESP